MPQQFPLDELTIALARVQGLLLTGEKVDRAVHLLTEGVRGAFPGSSGAGFSLLDGQGRRTSTGATDVVVREADAAQYELGQGPCLTAWATGRTVVVTDVLLDDRWPLWSSGVRDLAIRSVISTPLIGGTRCLGALKIYATKPEAYGPTAARTLERLVVPATTLLDNIQSPEAPKRFTQILAGALDSRDTVNRAQGFLMHMHGVSADEALQHLVQLSKRSRQTLLHVSTEILSSAEQPDDSPPDS